MTARPLAAVIVNWNGAAMTLRCVAALERSTARPDHVVIVDNGSTDGSAATIRGGAKDVVLVEAESNLGYSGGNNLGIRRALALGASSILILNNDVEVEPECIAQLERALARPGVGSAGPLLLFPGEPKRIWAAGGQVTHRENVSRLRGNGARLNGRFAEPESVDYLPGCALLVKRDVLERVGLLDETFFCYMEDVDLGRRIADAGLENRFVPDAVAIHDASASTGGGYTAARKYMNAANSVRYLRRHPSFRGWLGFAVFDVLGWPLCLANACVKGRPEAAIAKLEGIIDGLRGVAVTARSVERWKKSDR